MYNACIRKDAQGIRKVNMQITQMIDGSLTEIKNLLEKSLIEDIQSHEMTIPKDNDFTDFEYQKTLSSSSHPIQVMIHIEKMDESSYKSFIQTKQGTYVLSYAFEEISQDRVKVIYEESFVSSNVMMSLNHKLMSGLYGRRNKKKMQRVLNSLNQAIQIEKSHLYQ